MLEIIKYNSSLKGQWDQLIFKSRIDTFLFLRDYMDYHSDRFIDNSFMYYRKGKLEAVLPGNLCGTNFFSHQGLTYGGLVSTSKISATDIIDIFQLTNLELKCEGVKTVVYKPIPWIYHKIASQEDIYTLFRLKAEKIECHLSSTVFQKHKIAFNESRNGGIRKSRKAGVKIDKVDFFDEFWPILQQNLFQKHGKVPVHTLSEIRLLKNLFPDNIALFIASFHGDVVAGCVLFIMKNIIHVQYMAGSEEGKQVGALDLLLHEIINNKYVSTPVFDFGHSNEQMGHYLNESLIFQKEGFGGRGVVYETYKYKIQ